MTVDAIAKKRAMRASGGKRFRVRMAARSKTLEKVTDPNPH
jgi:hypothetical protein